MAQSSNTLMKLVAGFGVVPVTSIERVSDAVALIDALEKGGRPVAGITARARSAAADVTHVLEPCS